MKHKIKETGWLNQETGWLNRFRKGFPYAAYAKKGNLSLQQVTLL